jgi:hypothetical protein
MEMMGNCALVRKHIMLTIHQCTDHNTTAVGIPSSRFAPDIHLACVNYPYKVVGIEYWLYTTPHSEETTMKCDPEGEDPNGSASIPSQGVNLAHTTVRIVRESLSNPKV